MVVPEAIRPETLLIDEEFAVDDVRDFGDPAQAVGAEGGDLVGDEQAGVHRFGRLGGEGHAEPRRRDRFEVAGVAEERPGVIEVEGDALGGVDLVQCHA